MQIPNKLTCVFGFLTLVLVSCSNVVSHEKTTLLVKDQGSFAVGGTVVKMPGHFDPIKQGTFNPAGPNSAGQTIHGDHAYVFYQIPENARKLPLVFWHGYGQSGKTWESTPDGREGFQNIFLRRRFTTYLMEQPNRGKASKAIKETVITAAADEQLWFGIFRFGVWPELYKDVQFSKDPEALNQFFRQSVPDTGPAFQSGVYVNAASALLDKTGDAILVTHSASGSLGWKTAIKNKHVRAIVSYEPGGDFIFPEDENIEPVKLGARVIQFAKVSKVDFSALTKIPIIIYYGDNIPDVPSDNPGKEQWRVFLSIARKWVDVVNKNGGDARVVHLPEIGIKGNTHFPFSDLNNMEIADHLSKYLAEKKLD